MMNHINSYHRKKLRDLAPYDVFKTFYGEEVLKKLNTQPIPSEEAILLPTLLK